MNFLKKIQQKEMDDGVHLQFQKFSRGEFRDRALISAKKVKDKTTIFTSAEFANEMVKTFAEKVGSEKIKITGAVISTLDMKENLKYKEIKQFQGVKRYLLNQEMSGNEIMKIVKEFPKAFFALSFKFGNEELKIKPKAPKSGKPGSKGEAPQKPDFCKLITYDKKLVDEFVFEVPDFKKADITHQFVIEDIIVSPELKKTNDFSRMREEAKRKGKIMRKAIIDDKEIKTILEFEA